MSLTACTADLDRANIFTLATVDRTDAPGGKSHGPGGKGSKAYFTLNPTPMSELPTADLFAAGTDFTLYSIDNFTSDEPFLVFLSLPAETRAMLIKDEAFIDRGARKLVAEGARVALTSLASAERALESLDSSSDLAFVWNTGRCGSTLLHKAVSALNAVSLSEPHWLDQLHFNTPPIGDEAGAKALRRALRICVAVEVVLERAQTTSEQKPNLFCFNPKAAPTSILAPAVVDAFPNARHVFMYRACHKVVDSFTGLILPDGVSWGMWLAWRLRGVRALADMGAPTPPSIRSPLRGLSSLPVAGMTARWIHAIDAWVSLIEQRRASAPPGDPLVAALNLRMDEFTSKDLAVRKQVLRTILSHLGLVAENADDEALAPALAVFAVHSQAGSAMAGAKTKVVQEADIPLIQEAVVAGLSHLESAGLVVEKGGANVVLPRSLGV